MSRRAAVLDAGINLTPMIDVVFLLVIFFMVGSRFADERSTIDVDVPAAAARPMTITPDRRTVTVTADGRTMLDDSPMAIDMIATTLRAQAAGYPDLSVVVNGDAAMSHRDFVAALEAVRSAGVRNIGIGTRTR